MKQRSIGNTGIKVSVPASAATTSARAHASEEYLLEI